MLDKYVHIIEKLNHILFVLAVCMLPYPTTFSLYAWGFWIIGWYLEGRFLSKANWQWHRRVVPLCMLAFWVVCELLSYAWSIQKEATFDLLVRHLSFVVILPIAFCGVNGRYNWKWAARCFVLSATASVFVYGVYIYIVSQWDVLCSHAQLPDEVLSWTYFGEQISSLKHRLYYGTVLNLAVIVLLKSRNFALSLHQETWKRTISFFVCLCLLVLGIVLSGSRANLLALLVVAMVSVIQPLRGRTRVWVASVASVLMLVLCVWVYSVHPRFEQLHVKPVAGQDFQPSYEVEPRINIWYSVQQTPRDYLWKGVGAGCNAEYLKPIYASFHLDAFTAREFNSHNQYLGVLIDLGIIVAVFFLMIWLCYPFFYHGRWREWVVLVVLLVGLNMMTENMLERIDGVIMICCALLSIALLARTFKS